MRRGIVILGLLAGGCASATAPRPADLVYSDRTTATAQPAAALVYDPPVTLAEAPLDLSREGRDEAAYVGYEEGRTTFFYIHQDDHQLSYGFLGHRGRFGGSGGYFERQAVSDTVGVRYR